MRVNTKALIKAFKNVEHSFARFEEAVANYKTAMDSLNEAVLVFNKVKDDLVESLPNYWTPQTDDENEDRVEDLEYLLTDVCIPEVDWSEDSFENFDNYLAEAREKLEELK